MPIEFTQPELLLCEIQDSKLQIPLTIRQQYLNDPIRCPEWRAVLKEFDRKWTTEVNPTDLEAGERDQPGSDETFSWQTVYPDEPCTKSEMETKYGTSATSFAINDHLAGHIGAGVWLLENKAEQFLQDWEFVSNIFATEEKTW